jgi:hypothetical protein
MSKFSTKEMDKFLSENSTKPNWILAHPDVIWGYFFKKRVSRLRCVFFTRLGRLTRNKYIYWIGFPVVFIEGLSGFLVDNGWEMVNE